MIDLTAYEFVSGKTYGLRLNRKLSGDESRMLADYLFHAEDEPNVHFVVLPEFVDVIGPEKEPGHVFNELTSPCHCQKGHQTITFTMYCEDCAKGYRL